MANRRASSTILIALVFFLLHSSHYPCTMGLAYEQNNMGRNMTADHGIKLLGGGGDYGSGEGHSNNNYNNKDHSNGNYHGGGQSNSNYNGRHRSIKGCDGGGLHRGSGGGYSDGSYSGGRRSIRGYGGGHSRGGGGGYGQGSGGYRTFIPYHPSYGPHGTTNIGQRPRNQASKNCGRSLTITLTSIALYSVLV